MPPKVAKKTTLEEQQRQLKIKAQCCKRLHTEHDSYVKEEQDDKAKLDQQIQSGKAEHEYKQQKQVHEETVAMIANTRSRLQQSVKELQQFVAQNVTEADKQAPMPAEGEKPINLAQTQEYSDALVILQKLEVARLIVQ